MSRFALSFCLLFSLPFASKLLSTLALHSLSIKPRTGQFNFHLFAFYASRNLKFWWVLGTFACLWDLKWGSKRWQLRWITSLTSVQGFNYSLHSHRTHRLRAHFEQQTSSNKRTPLIDVYFSSSVWDFKDFLKIFAFLKALRSFVGQFPHLLLPFLSVTGLGNEWGNWDTRSSQSLNRSREIDFPIFHLSWNFA